jgi:N-acetylneuraminic acid mutarotase
MIVWGGYDGGYLNTGGRYDPAGNNWMAASATGAPAARLYHTAVWTGGEMVVWGGYDDTYLNDGGRYDPAGNSWTPVTTAGAPAARGIHTAVWTGSEMIVWGGVHFDGGFHVLNDGGRYHPAENTWTAVSTTGTPAARHYHTAVWTGREMIVWGGFGDIALNTGGRYDPSGNSWTALSSTGEPAARWLHTAAWTGSEMVVWGGYNGSSDLNTGGRYHAAENTWTPTTTTGAPSARFSHTSVWTGSEVIVWGGANGSIYFNDTFSYTPDVRPFDFTSVVRSGDNLMLSFRTVTGRNYTLWQSETMAAGSWTNTGLPALFGTGVPLTFTVPGSTSARRFFRVQADP